METKKYNIMRIVYPRPFEKEPYVETVRANVSLSEYGADCYLKLCAKTFVRELKLIGYKAVENEDIPHTVQVKHKTEDIVLATYYMKEVKNPV